MFFLTRFWIVFSLNLASQIHEKSWKIGAKSHSIFSFNFQSIFNRFSIDLGTSRTFKIIVFPKEKPRFSKTRLPQFTSIFHSILEPTCLHFPSQNRPTSYKKSILKGIYFLMYFCIDFFSLLAQFWRPTWLHLAPKTRQDGARNRSGGTQNREKTVLGSENGPELDFRLIFDGFGTVFWLILDGFGTISWWSCDGFFIDLWWSCNAIRCWIHAASSFRLQCWGGCAPPDPPAAAMHSPMAIGCWIHAASSFRLQC